MDLTKNDDFIELCASEYFKSFALRQDFTFEQYVHMRASRVI